MVDLKIFALIGFGENNEKFQVSVENLRVVLKINRNMILGNLSFQIKLTRATYKSRAVNCLQAWKLARHHVK